MIASIPLHAVSIETFCQTLYPEKRYSVISVPVKGEFAAWNLTDDGCNRIPVR
jgi:hypothetical protein